MKKLAFILALGFISNSFSQKESFISSSITNELNESRSQLNKNIFKNQNIDENFSWNGNSFVVDNFGSISIDVVSDNYRKAIETINNI
mgnify:CR=1 FL=1